MNIKDKIKELEKLKIENENALAYMSDISLNLDQSKVLLEKMNQTITSMKNMANSCSKLNNAVTLDQLVKKIDKIESKTMKALRIAKMSIDLGYNDAEELCDDINKQLYTEIKRLNEHLRNPENNNFKLDNVLTTHDIIRFMHQLGVQGAYNKSDLSSIGNQSLKNITLKRGEMNLFDVDDCLPQGRSIATDKINHFLIKKIIDTYNHADFQKGGYENFQGIVTRSSLISQIHMGCHYGEIEVQTVPNKTIDFYFRDTNTSSYENAKYRTKYVGQILKILGYDVKTHGNKTNAKWNGSDDKKLLDTFEKTLRLIASTKDLDLGNSLIDTYPNKAVNLFFRGTVNIYAALHKCYGKGEKDDKSIRV